MGLLFDLALVLMLFLGAAPFLALLAGRWGDWTSLKLLASTVSLLVALGLVGRLGRGRHSRRLDDLPTWALLPFLFAAWVALFYYNHGALTLRDCGEAALLSLLTFSVVFAEDFFERVTGWFHSGPETSLTVPKWVTTPCLAAAAAGAFWFAGVVGEPVFHVLGLLLTCLTLWSLKAPPFKL